MTVSKVARLHCISDVHVDYPQNADILRHWSVFDYQDDALILAGDVSDQMDRLSMVFEVLKSKFKEVLFVPGNHELWVKSVKHEAPAVPPSRSEEPFDSLAKFNAIVALARSFDVRMDPIKLQGESLGRARWVVPLLSWYSGPDEQLEDSLYVEKQYADKACTDRTHEIWGDFFFTRWPDHVAPLAEWFFAQNAARLSCEYDAPVISFSHFLPRMELIFTKAQIPDHDIIDGGISLKPFAKDPMPEFNFSRVAGSWQLDRQLRSIGSVLHIYGHQHRNRDVVIEHVRYVSHCLAYPKERGTTRAMEQGGAATMPKCVAVF